MFPHERSLVERLKNEPFALIGINTDDKGKDFYRTEAKTNGISWRSAMDGSTTGPICTKWGVQSGAIKSSVINGAPSASRRAPSASSTSAATRS